MRYHGGITNRVFERIPLAYMSFTTVNAAAIAYREGESNPYALAGRRV